MGASPERAGGTHRHSGHHKSSHDDSVPRKDLCGVKYSPDQDLEFILSLLAKETLYERCHRYCQHSEAGRC